MTHTTDGPSAEDINARLDVVGPRWWHSMDLGHGIITTGTKSTEGLVAETEALHLPDLTGRTVLDIGAWDGYFSFEAERRGAAEVMALDHYIWSIDLAAQQEVVAECHATGSPVPLWETDPRVWKPDALPGRACFDAAHWALGSKVGVTYADFMTADVSAVGSWDVVLFLGVLYHLPDPIAGLRKLAELTNDLAIIETELVRVPGLEGQDLWRYVEADSMFGDPSNFWLPSRSGLAAALRDAGFRNVDFMPIEIAGEQEKSPNERRARAIARDLRNVARGAKDRQLPHFRQVIHARK